MFKYLLFLTAVLAGCNITSVDKLPRDSAADSSADTGVDLSADVQPDTDQVLVDAAQDTPADVEQDTPEDVPEDGPVDQSPPSVWSPAPGTTWAWQLSGNVDTSLNVDMFDIDLYDVPQRQIDELHDKGKIVVCYFSAGTREDWRADADDFPAEAIGQKLAMWPGENWIDVRDARVREIMRGRMMLAQTRGCDGVEPDNVDGFANDNGLGLTRADQVDYLRFLSSTAHELGLSVGLKNSVDLIGDLVDDFDWGINESCLVYNECNRLAPFIASGKAVFHTEYVDDRRDGQAKLDTVCAEPSRKDFSTLVKQWDLEAWGLACP